MATGCIPKETNMNNTRSTDRKVIVVGGGIGGLAAALALARQGIRVELLE